jgi:hypothetical protein
MAGVTTIKEGRALKENRKSRSCLAGLIHSSP